MTPRDVSSLLAWLDGAVPGTLVPAGELADRIRQLPERPQPETRAEYLTAAAVAELLSVSEKFVYAHRDELGGRHFGSAVRFSRRAVEGYARRAR